MTIDSTTPVDVADEKYQRQILVHVSRTFALTIPQLPGDLRRAVTTAYLLCRIADTIEDEATLSGPRKLHYLTRFSKVAAGAADPAELAAELTPLLSDKTLPHERDLVANMDRIMRVCSSLDPRAQKAIGLCVEIMCVGMHYFQRSASIRGLPRLQDLDSYCYHVAGVVGEMLTDLFCTYSPEIAAHGLTLRRLAPSFGEGLQMTNILKDQWEDRSRGACWLPQEVFARRGFDLDVLRARDEEAFRDSLQELIGIAHGHLRNALAYTLLIPVRESGIRRFCAWSIGLALLTLRSIKDNPRFTAGAQVKISRREVMLVTAFTNLTVRSNRMLTHLFNFAARDLPLITQSNTPGGAELHAPIRQQWEREREVDLRSVQSG